MFAHVKDGTIVEIGQLPQSIDTVSNLPAFTNLHDLSWCGKENEGYYEIEFIYEPITNEETQSYGEPTYTINQTTVTAHVPVIGEP